MKRFTCLMCTMLLFLVILPMTAFGVEVLPRRASEYFATDSCYLQKMSSTEFRVWFDVTGTDIMDEIGTSVIVVQRSSDGSSWTDVKTYTKESYSQMVAYNTVQHSDYVTYSSATSGYYYRASVKFYAKNSSGSAGLYRYTSKI